jgi:predicted nucleic acid-binding protein
MKPVLLDTSGAIALLHRADPYHEKAKELAARLTTDRRPLITITHFIQPIQPNDFAMSLKSRVLVSQQEILASSANHLHPAR